MTNNISMMNIMDSIDNAKPYNEIVSNLYVGGVKADA